MLKPFTGLDSLENLNGEQLKNKALAEEALKWAVPVRLPRPISKLTDWKRFQKIYPIAPTDAVIYSEVTGACEQYKC